MRYWWQNVEVFKDYTRLYVDMCWLFSVNIFVIIYCICFLWYFVNIENFLDNLFSNFLDNRELWTSEIRIINRSYYFILSSSLWKDLHEICKRFLYYHFRNIIIWFSFFIISQAQFRSSLKCPHCQKESNTFDPFLCVSLPIPQRQLLSIYVTVVYLNQQPKQVSNFWISLYACRGSCQLYWVCWVCSHQSQYKQITQ